MKNVNLAEKNGMWKGDNVTIGALHDWARYHLSKPKLCINCKEVPPRDLANISQEYKRDLADWEWLCRRCHMTKDGRMNNLIRYPKRLKTINCEICTKLFLPDNSKTKCCSHKCGGMMANKTRRANEDPKRPSP